MSKTRRNRTAGPDRLRARRKRQQQQQQHEGERVPGTNATRYPCPCGCGGDVVSVPGGELASTMDALRTDEDRAWLDKELDAAARGDAAAALEACEHGLQVEGSTRLSTLEYLARVGEDAPEWLVARWVRRQAYEWMLCSEDPRITDAVLTVLVTHEIPEEVDERWLKEYGTRVAGGDVLCEEVALHASGGFGDFLEVKASEALLDRAGRVREWPNQPLGVYEYRDLDRDVLTVRDVTSGKEVPVLHVGCAAGTDPGQLVFGRLVPIGTAPGLMFEQRPIGVDRTTGTRLADELADGSLEGLMAILAEAGEAGRMPNRPGTRVGTYLWSDLLIVNEAYEQAAAESGAAEAGPAPRTQELMDDGLPRAVAEALGSCEIALSVAGRGNHDALAVVATHAGYNLAVPQVLAAARTHCTAPRTGPRWRTIAECLQEPQRSACLELARVAEEGSD